MKKYEFTGETKNTIFGKTLHRIRAIVRIDIGFRFVEVGEVGGWIESEKNLSHNYNAWVYDNAEVYDNARVCGNARVYDHALVCGDAEVCDNAWVCGNAEVYDNARVCGNARVYDHALVYDNARVYDNAEVCDNAWVYDNAEVCGDAEVCDNAWVYDNAEVCDNARVCGDARVRKKTHYMTVGPIGSRDDYTTFMRTKTNEIKVRCGCFFGTIDEFRAKIRNTHGESKHTITYNLAADLAVAQIELDEEE